MSLEDFYQEIKGVLHYFDLSFGEKDKVEVTITTEGVLFSYKNKSILLSHSE